MEVELFRLLGAFGGLLGTGLLKKKKKKQVCLEDRGARPFSLATSEAPGHGSS